MAMATAMYHSEKNPLKRVSRKHSETVTTARGIRARRLHKAFLRYHDPDNWPLLREALKKLGRADLIGNGKQQLIPHYQPGQARGKLPGRPFKTQHTGLPKTPALKKGKPKKVSNTKPKRRR